MVAQDCDVVIGVDTHKHTHTAAAVSGTGAILSQLTVPADAAGYQRLIRFGRDQVAASWPIEGTGSFGAGLTAALLGAGEKVVEVDPAAATGPSGWGQERWWMRCGQPGRCWPGSAWPNRAAAVPGGHPGAADHSRAGDRVPHQGDRGPARPGHQRTGHSAHPPARLRPVQQ